MLSFCALAVFGAYPSLEGLCSPAGLLRSDLFVSRKKRQAVVHCIVNYNYSEVKFGQFQIVEMKELR